MIAAGVLTERDRIELIDGEMIDIAPIGPKHAALTARLTKLFVLAVGEEAIVCPSGPVNLGDFSEPQSDLLLLQPQSDYYAGKMPDDRPASSRRARNIFPPHVFNAVSTSSSIFLASPNSIRLFSL
jgi:hypothetical protein